MNTWYLDLSKGDLYMNGELRQGRINNIREAKYFALPPKTDKKKEISDMPLVHEDCKCSGFTMAAVGASLLMFVGIIVYALIV